MSYVVRAKLKPLSEIPEEFLCCDTKRRQIQESADTILEVLPGTLSDGFSKCDWCPRWLSPIKVMAIKRGNALKPYISAACYDFDEGIGSTLSAGPEKDEQNEMY
jgi:hypothetical protein